MGPHAEVSEKLKDLHGLLNKKRFIPTQLFSDDKFYFDTDNIAYICIESMENNEHLSDIFEKLWALKDK